ncbi:MAG: hypothetical protein ACLQIQ_07505 [Beijerinckiaceae bacterium]
MMILRPPKGGRPANIVLGKLVETNPNGFVRVYNDADAAKLKAAGWTVAGIYAEDDFPALAKALPRRFKMKRTKGAPAAHDVIGRHPEYSQPDGHAIVDHDEALRLKSAGWQEAGTVEPADKFARALNGEALRKGLPESLQGRVDMVMAKISAGVSDAHREGKAVKAELERYAGDVRAHELIKAAQRAPQSHFTKGLIP